LTETATGVHLWSDVYNVAIKDVFTVQDEMTRRIVGAAAVKLTRLEQDRVLRKPTSNLAAYEYVLRGREAYGSTTNDANDEAQKLFRHAIDLDPNYAAAYAALGGAHLEAVVSGWAEFHDDELDAAETLAQKALALDPDTMRAYQVLAGTYDYRRQFDRALAQIDHALAINPSDPLNFLERGTILVWWGKPAEATSWLEATLRLDGANNRAGMELGIARYFLGQYAEAVEAFDRALAGRPGRLVQIMAHPVLAASYARLGRQQDVTRERAIMDHLAPFFEAEQFAAQFGTKETRENMLAGLKVAGFD
jgi:tetratricopeptide (TPR) repeat protein